ncbi:hypothetical protein LC612_35930 [Nostoc sp. CHAB 5834]|nr:hypothetical protein [Nostoc sp. CHAB 5834]
MTQTFKGKVEFFDTAGQILVLRIDPDSSFKQISYLTSNGFPIICEVTNTASFCLWGNGNDFGARLDGSIATLFLGGQKKQGVVRLFSETKQETFFLSGGSATKGSSMTFSNKNAQPTIALDGEVADIILGGTGQSGTVLLRNSDYTNTLRLEGGTSGKGSSILFSRVSGKPTIAIDGDTADMTLGGDGQGGTVLLRNESYVDTIRLDGSTGDINFLNADCAEDFDIAGLEDIEPGTVMIIGSDGKLYPSQTAYDKRVTGVLSGAGEYKPGIVLDKKPSQHKRLPVSLMGKVYCKVDADYSAVEVGDLLTTSPTLGHAMKADDPLKAFGAVIGKAMRPLNAGQGLIPILIALQ